MPDPQTGIPDGWEVVQPTAAPPPSKGRDFKILGVPVHMPAEEKPRLDSNMVGWGENGAGVAPEDALMAGRAGMGIAKAVSSGGMLAGVKDALAQATPVVKYELTRTTLEHMGVPAPMAIAAAMMVSGYKKGAAGEVAPETPSPPDSPHLDTAKAIKAGGLTPQQMRERFEEMKASGAKLPERAPVYAERPTPSDVPAMPPQPAKPVPAPARATPAPAKAGPVLSPGPPPAGQVSPQAALNGLAIAARRAKVSLSGDDYAALLPQVQAGTDPVAAIADRINARFNVFANLPSDAEVQAAVAARNASGRWANPRPGVAQ